MIKEIKELNIESLKGLVSYLLDNKSNIKKIEGNFNKEKKDNNYGSVFYKTTNPIFSFISIFFKGETIDEITLSGNFNLLFSDLIITYGNFRKAHSFRDETYFYFFNESEESKFLVSCRLSEDLDVNNDYPPINQLTIKLKDG